MALHHTVVTRMFTTDGNGDAAGMWTSRFVLALMGPMAGRMLGVGTRAPRGEMPNGQRLHGRARADLGPPGQPGDVLHGRDLGAPHPLRAQARIGGFWLPQHGIFMRGFGHFDAFDPARHVSAGGASANCSKRPRDAPARVDDEGVSGPLPARARRAAPMLLAALSIAIDLGLGQPAEHVLRSAVIATRLADGLGLTRDPARHDLPHHPRYVDRLPRRLARVRPMVRRRHRRQARRRTSSTGRGCRTCGS